MSVLILVIHFTGCAEMDTKEDISGPGNNAADVESTPSKLKIIDKQRFIEKGSYISWNLSPGEYEVDLESDTHFTDVLIWDGDDTVVYKKEVAGYTNTFTISSSGGIKIICNPSPAAMTNGANIHLIVHRLSGTENSIQTPIQTETRETRERPPNAQLTLSRPKTTSDNEIFAISHQGGEQLVASETEIRVFNNNEKTDVLSYNSNTNNFIGNHNRLKPSKVSDGRIAPGDVLIISELNSEVSGSLQVRIIDKITNQLVLDGQIS
ncbi:MAG: hypothetical protein ACOC4Y_02435 [bacterium]